MSDEARMSEPKSDKPETDIEHYRRQAAHILMKHFSEHPEYVIVASVTGGKIAVDCSQFENLGLFVLTEKILVKQIQQSFEKALIQLQQQAQEQKPKETVQ